MSVGPGGPSWVAMTTGELPNTDVHHARTSRSSTAVVGMLTFIFGLVGPRCSTKSSVIARPFEFADQWAHRKPVGRDELDALIGANRGGQRAGDVNADLRGLDTAGRGATRLRHRSWRRRSRRLGHARSSSARMSVRRGDERAELGARPTVEDVACRSFVCGCACARRTLDGVSTVMGLDVQSSLRGNVSPFKSTCLPRCCFDR